MWIFRRKTKKPTEEYNVNNPFCFKTVRGVDKDGNYDNDFWRSCVDGITISNLTKDQPWRARAKLRIGRDKEAAWNKNGPYKRANKKHLYSKKKKKYHSKSQPSTFNDPSKKKYAKVFHHANTAVDIGVGIAFGNVTTNVLTTIISSGDFGTRFKPHHKDTIDDAKQDYKKRKDSPTIFSTLEELIPHISPDKINEVLGRLRFEIDDSCCIMIFKDNLPSRMLAQARARDLLRRLKARAKENGEEFPDDYTVPIRFYPVPETAKQNAITTYATEQQQADIQKVLENPVGKQDQGKSDPAYAKALALFCDLDDNNFEIEPSQEEIKDSLVNGELISVVACFTHETMHLFYTQLFSNSEILKEILLELANANKWQNIKKLFYCAPPEKRQAILEVLNDNQFDQSRADFYVCYLQMLLTPNNSPNDIKEVCEFFKTHQALIKTSLLNGSLTQDIVKLFMRSLLFGEKAAIKELWPLVLENDDFLSVFLGTTDNIDTWNHKGLFWLMQKGPDHLDSLLEKIAQAPTTVVADAFADAGGVAELNKDNKKGLTKKQWNLLFQGAVTVPNSKLAKSFSAQLSSLQKDGKTGLDLCKGFGKFDQLLQVVLANPDSDLANGFAIALSKKHKDNKTGLDLCGSKKFNQLLQKVLENSDSKLAGGFASALSTQHKNNLTGLELVSRSSGDLKRLFEVVIANPESKLANGFGKVFAKNFLKEYGDYSTGLGLVFQNSNDLTRLLEVVANKPNSVLASDFVLALSKITGGLSWLCKNAKNLKKVLKIVEMHPTSKFANGFAKALCNPSFKGNGLHLLADNPENIQLLLTVVINNPNSDLAKNFVLALDIEDDQEKTVWHVIADSSENIKLMLKEFINNPNSDLAKKFALALAMKDNQEKTVLHVIADSPGNMKLLLEEVIKEPESLLARNFATALAMKDNQEKTVLHVITESPENMNLLLEEVIKEPKSLLATNFATTLAAKNKQGKTGLDLLAKNADNLTKLLTVVVANPNSALAINFTKALYDNKVLPVLHSIVRNFASLELLLEKVTKQPNSELAKGFAKAIVQQDKNGVTVLREVINCASHGSDLIEKLFTQPIDSPMSKGMVEALAKENNGLQYVANRISAVKQQLEQLVKLAVNAPHTVKHIATAIVKNWQLSNQRDWSWFDLICEGDVEDLTDFFDEAAKVVDKTGVAIGKQFILALYEKEKENITKENLWFWLQLVGHYIPEKFTDFIVLVKKRLGAEKGEESLCGALLAALAKTDNKDRTGLYVVAQNPDNLRHILTLTTDSSVTETNKSSVLQTYFVAALRTQCTRDGQTGLHAIAQHSPQYLRTVLMYVAESPDASKNIANALKALDKSSKKCSGLTIVAMNAPETLNQVLTLALKAPLGKGCLKSAIANWIAQDELWLDKVARYAPRHLGLVLTLLPTNKNDHVNKAFVKSLTMVKKVINTPDMVWSNVSASEVSVALNRLKILVTMNWTRSNYDYDQSPYIEKWEAVFERNKHFKDLLVRMIVAESKSQSEEIKQAAEKDLADCFTKDGALNKVFATRRRQFHTTSRLFFREAKQLQVLCQETAMKKGIPLAELLALLEQGKACVGHEERQKKLYQELKKIVVFQESLEATKVALLSVYASQVKAITESKAEPNTSSWFYGCQQKVRFLTFYSDTALSNPLNGNVDAYEQLVSSLKAAVEGLDLPQLKAAFMTKNTLSSSLCR